MSGLQIECHAKSEATQAVMTAEHKFIHDQIKCSWHMDITPNELRLEFWKIIAEFYGFNIAPKGEAK